MQPKFCSKCGKPLKEGDKFCRKCGAPIKMAGTTVQQPSAPNTSAPNIPSFSEVEKQFNSADTEKRPPAAYNPEGTVLLGGPSTASNRGGTVRRADITLSLEEMLRGCSKVVDFGTGRRYELIIPAGLSPGDKIAVKDTGIVDPDTGRLCDIELTAAIG